MRSNSLLAAVSHASISLVFSTQALTTLNLSNNSIDAEAAQYLGEALMINKVRSYLVQFFIFVTLTDTTDADDAESLE